MGFCSVRVWAPCSRHRLTCPEVCGIFPNPCLLHWQADSQPLELFHTMLYFLPSHICKLPLRRLPDLSLLNNLSIQNYLWSKKEYFPLTKCFSKYWAPLVAQTVKNLPAVQETWVQSLGQEDPLERARQPTPVFLPGECLWTERPVGLQFIGSHRIRHD